MNRITSLYVHIPFCKHICSYCDFCKVFYDEKKESLYVDVLLRELRDLKIDHKLKTIYIGGGSPSCLKCESLERIFIELRKYLSDEYEFSIEVNSENMDKEKVELFAKYGINRVSIGVQSNDEKTLKFLGREHSIDEVKKCVDLLKKYEMNNYSFDFIYGIKNVGEDVILKDMDLVEELCPKHVSFYSLILEENTLLKVSDYIEEDEEKVREQYDLIYNKLKHIGYKRYEVSNFAVEGYECRHNLVYWNNEEYYAIGVGASSYVDGKRYTSSRSLTRYLKGELSKECFEVDKKREYIMLKLRLDEGIKLDEYKSIFCEDFLLEYSVLVKKFMERGLLEVVDGYVRCTYEGMLLLDSMLVEFM